MKASMPSLSSDPVWDTRVNLAALYRLFEHFEWSDIVYTHLSARVPGESDKYFINSYGLLFDEICASNLVMVDFDGRVVSGAGAYNKAGHAIHSAVLKARPDVNYVLHSHTRAGAAVSSMRCGLLPLSQPALAVSSTLAYHTYGVAEVGGEEGAHVVGDLGEKFAMLLQNHGLLVCGRTAAEAFLYHYFLDMACGVQLDILSATDDYVTPPADEIRKLAEWGAPRTRPWGDAPWSALMRLLDRKDASFRR